MIAPKAIHLIIRHLDAIDRAVAKRMNRKRPWLEPALTALLCDLLDAETQDSENLEYSVRQLNQDLAALDGLVSVTFEVETHEYDARMERWVTQADLGFVVSVVDYLLPEQSWSLSWLLQAKRLYPDKRNPLRYAETSRFGAANAQQLQRMKRLLEIVGVPFVKYLLYCPRPSYLDDLTQKKLTHLRNRQLANDIFDYTLGLELHEQLGMIDSSLAAGLFVGEIEEPPRNLGQVHGSVLSSCFPLSWFLATHLLSRNSFCLRRRHPCEHPEEGRRDPSGSPPEDWVNGIVTGESSAIKKLIADMGTNTEEPFAVLPPHTLTINVRIGQDLDPGLRQIQQE